MVEMVWRCEDKMVQISWEMKRLSRQKKKKNGRLELMMY